MDIPGPSLRLVVMDRVPWPKPDICHKERRRLFGERDFDDHLTRLRLKQAFGRLIRTKTDRGVVVVLDKQVPSRLLSAFPSDVPIERVGLAEALSGIRHFFENKVPESTVGAA